MTRTSAVPSRLLAKGRRLIMSAWALVQEKEVSRHSEIRVCKRVEKQEGTGGWWNNEKARGRSICGILFIKGKKGYVPLSKRNKDEK